MRKALLISNPGEAGEERYCDGVYVDVKNYIDFLTSPLGGFWFKHEIEHLERPTTQQLKQKLSAIPYQAYSLIIFCGHGYFSPRLGTTVLELRKNEEIGSLDLRDNASKRSILLDCCRRVHYDLLLDKAMRSAICFAEPQLNPDLCRSYFDRCLDDCANGIVVGYACCKGETAGESKTRGGYYSSSVINSAESWRESSRPELSKFYYKRSIVQIHNEATGLVTKLSGGTQNTDIEKPRSEPYFPFAVMA